MCKRMIKVLLFSILILGLTASVYAQPILNPVNGHYYEIIDVSSSPLNWFQARDDAATRSFLGMQGYLATITSPLEQDFIINNFAGIYALLGGYQLDNQATSSDGWQWITGESWNYTYWDTGTGQPNDNVGGEDNEQNCLEMYPSLNSPWNDGFCLNTKNFYLIEYETENCVGSVCYVPCDPMGAGCPNSFCYIDAPGLIGEITVGQVTYLGSGVACVIGGCPRGCTVFVPVP